MTSNDSPEKFGPVSDAVMVEITHPTFLPVLFSLRVWRSLRLDGMAYRLRQLSVVVAVCTILADAPGSVAGKPVQAWVSRVVDGGAIVRPRLNPKGRPVLMVSLLDEDPAPLLQPTDILNVDLRELRTFLRSPPEFPREVAR